MIRKEYGTRLLLTIFISASICIAVNALFFNAVLTPGIILQSIGPGIAIWLLSEFAFYLIAKKWPHHILPSYITLFVIIAIGTGTGLWLFRVTALEIILLVIASSDVCGLSIAVFFQYIYKKKLNDYLKKFKNDSSHSS
jgi:hypothetical protein